ncbi:MAG: lytic transglycosylase domain-containing protein [Candidatus Omnitrophica bacterium]|nr:lytic transglycosylase domain-containing protein [Candidatus Omnitrophota bacterium]
MPWQEQVSPSYFGYQINGNIFENSITALEKAQILSNILGVIESYIIYKGEKVKPLKEYRKVNNHYEVKMRRANGTEFWYKVKDWGGNFSFIQLPPQQDILTEKDMPLLLVPLIIAESSFNPRAINPHSGARGLTQITWIAWQDLARWYPHKYKNDKATYEKEILELDKGREAGLDYLNIILNYLRYYQTHGYPTLELTLENILTAYNWGISNLIRYGWKNAPQETQEYIKRIRAMLYSSSK